MTEPGTTTRFPFAAPAGSSTLPPWLAMAEVDDAALRVRFGPWRMTVPRSEIDTAQVSGPYRAVKALGVRLSLADRGLTFGSTAAGGVCVEFTHPRRGIEPFGLLRHPGLTLTVADPDGLVAALRPGA